MNSFKIGSQIQKNNLIKYGLLFVFGILFTLASTHALTVVTGINNAVQYISQIVLTDDGSASGTTGVILDGPNSQIGSTEYCDKTLTSCKKFTSLVTTGEINNYVTDKYISAATFSNGTVTLSGMGGLSNITVNLDGRYRTGSDLFLNSGGNIYYNGSLDVGIGTSTPSEDFQVSTTAQIGSNYSCAPYNGGAFLRIIGQEPGSMDSCSPLRYEQNFEPNIQFNYDKNSGPDINWKIAGDSVFSIEYSTGTNQNSYVEKLTIESNGNVGIGDTNPSYLLDVNGTGNFTNAVYASAFFYNSDLRLKDNLQLIQSPLDKILSLNGYTFNWKNGGGQDIGIIAQEVEKVFPQAVSTKVDGYKAVEYGHLIAPLIEAVKELNQKIETQQKEIDILKSQLK